MNAEEMKAMIFDIQRFCLHDGPGIRTTVFFKGCNLRCAWCHNPESFLLKKQLSYDASKCIMCGQCTKSCPFNAHLFCQGKHYVDFSKCNACGICVESCITDALRIIGKEMTVNEVIKEIEKDRKYYEQSGGGATLSGGECTLQFKFCLALLKELKAINIHTCIETNLMLDNDKLKQLIPFTDLFLADYKLSANELHSKYTGADNAIIMSNLDMLNSMQCKVVLRCPIIPGINDNIAHFENVAEIYKKYRCIEYVEIMPYHSTGKCKWSNLGIDYIFDDMQTAGKNMADEWRKILSNMGVNVR